MRTLGWQLDEKWQVFGDLGVTVRDRGEGHPHSPRAELLANQALENWLIGVDLLGHTHGSEVERSDLSIGLATQMVQLNF